MGLVGGMIPFINPLKSYKSPQITLSAIKKVINSHFKSH